MVYTIEIKTSNDNPTFDITCTRDSLFDVLWILQEAVYVRQFRVGYGVGLVIIPKDIGLGQGNFPKWVTKFTYPNY